MKRNKSGCLCITKSRCGISHKCLGLQFLVSNEDKIFVIAGYLRFLTCFSITSHMSDLTLPFLFPFPLFFFLADTWIQFILCYLFALILFPILFTFLAPIYVTICILCKEEVFFSICLQYQMQKTLLFIQNLMTKIKFSAE